MMTRNALIAILVVLQFSAAFTDQSIPTGPKGLGAGQLGTGPRIINGTLASVGATKHQVSVRRRLNDGYFFGTGHICGGSLIGENVVLSATHCFVNQDTGAILPDEDFIVVMGNLDRFENNENTRVYDLKNIVHYVHNIFNLSTYENDISILFLNDSVPVNHPTIKPILINRKPVASGTMCQVTGWGYTEDNYLSDYLMTVDVPVIDFNVCTNDTDYSPGLIREGMMCAGYLKEGERDACGGDSGGPLVCNGLQTGIVSWGSGCALPRLPGVYTDVVYYFPWIEAQVKANNGTLAVAGGAMSSFKSSVTLVGFLMVATILLNIIF